MNLLEERRRQRLRGLAFMAVGIFLFTIQDMIIKGISAVYPVHQIVFIRSFIALPLIIFIAHFEHGLRGLHTQRLWEHVLRGTVMFAAYTAYYLGIAALPVAMAVAISFSAPLFITLLAIPFLGEKVSPTQWTALLAGFAGVLIVMQPWGVEVDMAVLLPAFSALCYAIAQLYTRHIGKTDSGPALAFYITLIFIVLSSIAGLLTGSGALEFSSHPSMAFLLRSWVWPTEYDLYLMLVCGVVAALGVYCLSQGYRLAEANRAAMVEYTSLPWVALWGFLFFNEIPGLNTILGVALVILAGVSIAYRERSRAAA